MSYPAAVLPWSRKLRCRYVSTFALLLATCSDVGTARSHVFRITKSLGWIPAKADRETAFHHLNNRVTPKLKYALHSLLVKHGRGCPNCSASGSVDDRHKFEGPCPIKVRIGSLSFRNVR